MDKAKLIELAKNLAKHVQSNPDELKKFETPSEKPAEAPKKEDTAPVAAPKAEKKAFEPFFLSKARAKEIGETLAKKFKKSASNPDEKADAELGEEVERDVVQHLKENAPAERKEGILKAEKCAKCSMEKPLCKCMGKKELSAQHPANGKMIRKEEQCESDRDPNGQMTKDEMKPKAPAPAPKAPAAKPAAPAADHVSVPRHVLQALHAHHSSDEVNHFESNGRPKNHVASHWIAVGKLLGSK